jgi:hypothetical protein
VILEANQLKDQKEKYFKNEAEKVAKVLKAWKENSKLSKKELGVKPWEEKDSDENPLTERELDSMKRFLNKYNQTAHESIFGASGPAVDNSSFARP